MFIALRAEGATFVKEATKEGEKAGDAAGKSFGARLKASAGTLIGTALAAGFAVATKGALEAEAAQGKFMAATGRTREEAKAFVSDMNGLAGTSGTVGKTFEEIAAAGIAVSKQFGITGEDAQQLTLDVLEFAKVSGQDAELAAGQLEDALSAFGLGAEDAAGMMDVLIASSQKFGTDISPETLDQLKKMAPALQAMGVGAEEAVGFLNLFETAGLDAAGAMKGFNAAIANIPPGESLQSVLEKVQAIEDPLERAQYATEIFGAKAGSGLANALKPGGLALDDFIVTTEEAAGTVDTASENMLTLSDRIKGWADKALAGAREIGNQFGPVVTGTASLVSLAGPLTTSFGGLKGAIGGVGDTLKRVLIPNLAVTTTEMAATEKGALNLKGAMLGVGVAAGAFAAGVLIANEAGNELEASYEGATAKLKLLTEATPAQIAEMRESGRVAIERADALKFMGFWDTEASVALRELGQEAVTTADRLEGLNIGPLNMGGSLREAVAEVEAAGPMIYSGAAGAFSAVPQAWRDIAAKTVELAAELGPGISDEIRSSKDNVANAMDDLKWAMLNPLAGAEALARIAGALTGTRLREGLASKNEFIRSQAVQTRLDLIAEWEKISGRAYIQGVQGANALERGLRTFTPVELNRLYTQGSFGGINPMTGKPWGARASGGPVSADMPYLVGEEGPELFIPKRNGFIAPNQAGAGSVPIGGNTYITNNNAEIVGLPLYAETPAAVARQMSRVAALGELPQRAPSLRRTG